MGGGSEGEGLAAGKRQAPTGDALAGREDTAVPGIEERPTPIVSHTCGTW
jgi:hypothetical protein